MSWNVPQQKIGATLDWIDYIAATLFTILGAGCLVTVLIGVPGTWLMILIALGLEFLQRLWAAPGSDWMFPIWVFVVVVLIAGLGELLELVAGAFGAKKGGASRKGMLGALLGGVMGAIIGTFLIPIPLVGSLVGALVGCAGGAILGELNNSKEIELKDTLKPAAGAVVGRVLGTLAKLPCALMVWVILSVSAFVRISWL
ncbi:MAG: DUF456 domain-containing protein [Phycisphaerales bacterium]|nr:DUF456 domain-containing protein [Phycisphaerales bacterium]